MENVLIQITLGLYRSLAREFTRAFRFVATNVPVGRGIHFRVTEMNWPRNLNSS